MQETTNANIEINDEFIEEARQHISDSLQKWSNIALVGIVDGWGVRINYSDDDLLNLYLLIIAIYGNVAAKKGKLHLDSNANHSIDEPLMITLNDVFGVNIKEIIAKKTEEK